MKKDTVNNVKKLFKKEAKQDPGNRDGIAQIAVKAGQ